MIGVIMDALLMLLLACALAYGVRLDKKLKSLRDGQLAFAGAVNELNMAASRAEAALASLRASGQETDLLHDRIVKARAVKAELEALIARTGRDIDAPPPAKPSAAIEPVRPQPQAQPVSGGLLSPEQVERFTPVLQALAANQSAKQSLNRARRSLDDDLFAA
ncbi:MAG: hypothetical protein J0M36_13075 [Caulobacterales bacterium]|nr:hypothetical protein [Caulobacterales bacterium]